MTHSNSGARHLPWMWLAVFAALVALLGGSSRADPAQLVVLRPLTILFLIPALYVLRWEDTKGVRSLIFLLGALGFWMALQLVPLPPDLWHQLPGREPIVALDAALGFDGLWRSVSLAPARGWNAVASLALPAAALLLALAARADTRMLLLLIAAMGVLDAALGLLQVLSGANSPLYYYQYSNRGSPIGIFANENHSSVFSACVLMVIVRLGLDGLRNGERGPWRIVYPAAFVLVLLAGLVSGSRGGFVTTFVALLGVGLMVLSAEWQSPHSRRGSSMPGGGAATRYWLIIFIAVVALSLPALFFAFERVPAFSDILAKDAFQDLRWAVWPTLQEMMATYWLLGTGFGSFEQVYHIFEPDNLLRSSYLNQAHNDWAQLVIEGGVPAVAILIGLVVWLGKGLWSLGKSGSNVTGRRIFWLAIFSIIAFASAFDYPLRAPAFQLVGIWFLLAFALERGYDAHSGMRRSTK